MTSFKRICVTPRKVILVIVTFLISGFILANVFSTSAVSTVIVKENDPTEVDGMWIPTEEDIAYQDSMWTIINKTQSDVDTIKKDIDKILYKLDRLEYEDGTWDSVRIKRTTNEKN